MHPRGRPDEVVQGGERFGNTLLSGGEGVSFREGCTNVIILKNNFQPATFRSIEYWGPEGSVSNGVVARNILGRAKTAGKPKHSKPDLQARWKKKAKSCRKRPEQHLIDSTSTPSSSSTVAELNNSTTDAGLYQRKLSILVAAFALLFFASTTIANTLFVDANGTNALSPFADWSTPPQISRMLSTPRPTAT